MKLLIFVLCLSASRGSHYYLAEEEIVYLDPTYETVYYSYSSPPFEQEYPAYEVADHSYGTDSGTYEVIDHHGYEADYGTYEVVDHPGYETITGTNTNDGYILQNSSLAQSSVNISEIHRTFQVDMRSAPAATLSSRFGLSENATDQTQPIVMANNTSVNVTKVEDNEGSVSLADNISANDTKANEV